MLAAATLKYILTLLVAYLTTYFLTPWVIWLAQKYGAIDRPDSRRVHTEPTPRGGGIAVFIGFHFACGATFLVDTLFPWRVGLSILNVQWWLVVLVASTVLLLVGVVDDLRSLKPKSKLLGQIFVSSLAYLGGIRIEGIAGLNLPYFSDYFVTVFWILLLINAFNLIDGYDGVASGLAVISSLGIAGTFVFRHLPLEALIVVCLIGACLAFLRFNRHPARIFLGDSGSMFLGFLFAVITISTASKGTGLAAIWVPILALGIPLYDTALAVWRRTARRMVDRIQGNALLRGVMTADMDHLHHRLDRVGITPRNVSATLYLANSVLVLVGMLALLFRDSSQGIFVSAFVISSFIVLRYAARGELLDSGFIVIHSLRNHQFGKLIYVLLDIVVIGLALGVTSILCTESFDTVSDICVTQLPAWASLSLGCLLLVEPYRLIWTPESLSRQVRLSFTFGAWLLFLFSLLVIHRDGTQSAQGMATLFCSLILLGSIGVRGLLIKIEGKLLSLYPTLSTD